MSYPKLAQLVQKLATSTEYGAIDWARTEKPNYFQASLAEYSVRIALTNPARGDYLLQILDPFGDTVEEVTDDQLVQLLPNATAIMKDLYDVARRKVMGVEDALDAILKQLDDEMPF